MFAPKHLYTQTQYIDLTALAEARAAEAAATAAEAEYLAKRAKARVQSPFWASTTPPARRLDQFSCDFLGRTEPRQLFFGYSPYYGEEYAPRSPCAFGNHGGTVSPHHDNRHAQHAITQLELETQLREERLARLRLEEELKELKVREQQLSRHPFLRFFNQGPQLDGENNLNALLGGRAPQLYEPAWPRPAPKPKAAAAYGPPITPEDVIASMILQNIDLDHYRDSTAQQAVQPKRPAGLDQKAPKQLRRKTEQGGPLIDQLKARYEREGQDEIRDTIQSIYGPIPTPAMHQPTKQPPRSAPTTNQGRDTASRAIPNSNHSFDLVAAILGSLIAVTDQALVQSASSNPARTTSSGTPAGAAAAPINAGIKGKGKETLAVEATAGESTSKDVVNALEKVERIERAFYSLEAEFAFPVHLDFSPSSHPSYDSGDVAAVFPHLAYTARNHPVRYYEQTLSSLLQDLDLIESHGNPTLRMRRKAAAGAIEKALEDLEREVAGRWKASVARKERKEGHESISTPLDPARVVAGPEFVYIPIVGRGSIPKDPVTTTSEANIDEDFALASDNATPAPVSEAPEVETPSIYSPVSPALGELVAWEEFAPPVIEQDFKVPSPAFQTAEEPATTQLEVPEDEVVDPELDLAVDVTPPSGPSPPSPASPKVITDDTTFRDAGSDDGSDAFLLTQPSALELGETELKTKKRRSVEIEDLGSEWEDVDAA